MQQTIKKKELEAEYVMQYIDMQRQVSIYERLLSKQTTIISNVLGCKQIIWMSNAMPQKFSADNFK